MSEITSGLVLMVIGMVAVSVFLVMLIMMMSAIHWVDRRFFPEPEPQAKQVGGVSIDTIAAITAAVHQHIRSRK